MSGVSEYRSCGVCWCMKAIGSLVLAAVSLHADALNDVYGRMDKAAQSFKGMTADIKQTVHTAVVNDDSVSTGTIKVKRAKPGDTKILVDFTSPEPKTSSVDGQQVRIYLPKANVVQVIDIGDKRSTVDQVMLLGFGASGSDLKKSYDVSLVGAESVNGQAASHLKLIPKSTEVRQRLPLAELWISDALGSPVQQKLTTSPQGDYTIFTYSNLKFPSNISDSDLRLKPKKGAQIQVVGK